MEKASNLKMTLNSAEDNEKNAKRTIFFVENKDVDGEELVDGL
jgi:hypothetical protein